MLIWIGILCRGVTDQTDTTTPTRLERTFVKQSFTVKTPQPPMGPLPELRGIFGEHGDSQAWLDATKRFPNGVPRFDSRAECLEFMKEYHQNHGGSNPKYPHLMHIFTMLISWEQIETILLPNIEKARKEPSQAHQERLK